MHSIIYIIIVAVLVFVAMLSILFIVRPIFVLQRDPRNGTLIDAVSGGKLIALSIILTIIIVIVMYLVYMMSIRMQTCAMEQEL